MRDVPPLGGSAVEKFRRLVERREPRSVGRLRREVRHVEFLPAHGGDGGIGVIFQVPIQKRGVRDAHVVIEKKEHLMPRLYRCVIARGDDARRTAQDAHGDSVREREPVALNARHGTLIHDEYFRARRFQPPEIRERVTQRLRTTIGGDDDADAGCHGKSRIMLSAPRTRAQARTPGGPGVFSSLARPAG